MRRLTWIATWAICASTPAWAAEPDKGPFQGEWRTSIGTITLDQKGDAVTGSYGPGGKFVITGKAQGKALTFEYQEGEAKGDARFLIDPSGNAFKGSFQIRNGRAGPWNGWRPDAQAPSDALGAFAGFWLTDFGLMELKQEGKKIQGRYALRGTSAIEGTATGRRLDFRFTSFRAGKGWLDLTPDGKSLKGAANTDGFAAWFGWQGRSALNFPQHAPLQPGKIVDGSTRGLLTYSVRAPEGFAANSDRKWPAVLILHGSNMNGNAYVNTIAQTWPDIARDYILLGINGETCSSLGEDPQFNYSYVNYVGRSTYKGYPGTDRESPALVSDAMAELKGVYPIAHYLVGGHSQGGFLTYSLLMNFPESMAGAFPISCGVIFQCEPGAYADETLRKAQREVPLAIVHGKTDPVVGFTMGQYSGTLFGESGWPAFRFWVDDAGGHMFARLPVGPAIRWLEAHASRDPDKLLAFAAERIGQQGYRDAVAALGRVESLKPNDAHRRRAQELSRSVEEKAAAGAAKYLPLIREAKDNAWIDGFLAFRDDFEFAPAAHEAMAAFAELRGRHEAPAKKAFDEARQFFQQGKSDEGYGKYREIVESHYASPLYRIVKQWLADRK